MEFLEIEMDKLQAMGSARDIERCRKLLQSTASVTTAKSQPIASKASNFKIKSEKVSVAAAELSGGMTASEARAESSSASTASKSGAAASKGMQMKRKIPPCVDCQGAQGFFRCPEVVKMSPGRILQIVVDTKLCHRCLAAAHPTGVCDKEWLCCKHCSATDHHTLTHKPSQDGSKDKAYASNQPKAASATSQAAATISNASGRIGLIRNFRPIVTVEVMMY